MRAPSVGCPAKPAKSWAPLVINTDDPRCDHTCLATATPSTMPVGLLLLLVMEGIRTGRRTYNKRQAKKYEYDGILASDQLARPIDRRTGRRLSKNEARAWASHQRQVQEDERREREWRSKGNVLPKYRDCATEPKTSRAAESRPGSSSPRSASTPDRDSADDDDDNDEGSQAGTQDWQRWSLSGAPCYTERDEVARRSMLSYGAMPAAESRSLSH